MTYRPNNYSDLPARIEGERVILRPLSQFDAPALSRLGGDYVVASQTASLPSPFPLLAAELSLAQIDAKARAGVLFPYAITKDGGDMIGLISLIRKDIDSMFELGYWLGRPYWGKVYGYDAARSLIAAAVTYLGVRRIHARVLKENTASLALLNKLGFQYTGADHKTFIMARMAKAEGWDLCWNYMAQNKVASPIASQKQSQLLPFRQKQATRP